MSAHKASHLFNRIDQFEQTLCLYANGFCRFRSVHGFFTLISRLGDGGFWFGLILTIPLLYGISGLLLAIKMTVTGLLCAVIYKSLKHKLTRERPFISFPNIFCGTAPLDRYSFPSGHTLHAVCFNLMLAIELPSLGLAILPFTLFVMLSRVVLGLHYPSDVAVGALIGICIATASFHALPSAEILVGLQHIGLSVVPTQP